jgi:hypothetical protein
MGIEGLEAEHRTLVLGGATPRQEVQLLRLLQPPALLNPGLATLRQRGFNHICLATDDLDGELARLRAAGVTPRNAVMAFTTASWSSSTARGRGRRAGRMALIAGEDIR